jgi:hypothetical protein
MVLLTCRSFRTWDKVRLRLEALEVLTAELLIVSQAKPRVSCLWLRLFWQTEKTY